MPDPFDEEQHEGMEGHEEEDGEDGRDSTRRTSNDHVILLVDARRNMFEYTADSGMTCFEAAMKAALQVLKTKVVASSSHRVGVTLFGTKKSSDSEETSSNVYTFLDLAPPSAKRIRDLEALSRGGKGFESTCGSMGDGEPCPLRRGLWSCQSEFMTIKQPGDLKRIFLFTNDDDPLKDNQEEKDRVHIVAKDIIESSIEIQLFHMKKGGREFDPTKFFHGIMARDGDEYNEQALGGGAAGVSEVMERVRRKESKKRTLAQLPFEICQGLEGRESTTKVSFDVKVYAMIHPASKSSAIYLDARRNKPVQVISKYMDDRTGAQLDEHEIRRYLEFCGERSYVTPDEMASLKAICPKGIVLFGFKEMDSLRPDFNLRSPYFVYPDEESTSGSSEAFAALHAAMIERGVYAVARLTMRDRTAPRMVALVAQEEQVEDGVQVSPPGMNAVMLPFADEVRELKPNPDAVVEVKCSEEAVVAAESLIKALQLDGLDCHAFDNPVLQRHYAGLEAIALAEEEVGWDAEKDDTTRPNDEAIDAAVTEVVDVLDSAFGGDEGDDAAGVGKRSSAKTGGAPAKKPKTEQDISGIDWKEVVAHGKTDRFVAPILKAFLKSQGLSTAGNKSVLVERIEQHVQSG